MTEQEVFDKVWNHIITQGVPSVDDTGKCLYRGPNGTMCAAGIFLTDEQADFGDACLGGSDWYNIREHFSDLDDLPHNLIGSLQDCHDNASRSEYGGNFLEEFKAAACGVAKFYGLTIPSVE